jgi:glucose/arabinose dehydrogenase
MRQLRVLLVLVMAGLTVGPGSVSAATSPLTTVRVASGLTRPTFAAPVPGDSGRLFITQQGGLIKVLDLGTGMVLSTPFLDLTSVISCCGDRGLYAIAFHPSYATNGYFFVSYTNAAGDSELARYQVLGDPATSNVANPASASILLTIAEPHQSHNIGWIAFGPNDGYLYIGKTTRKPICCWPV